MKLNHQLSSTVLCAPVSQQGPTLAHASFTEHYTRADAVLNHWQHSSQKCSSRTDIYTTALQ